MLEKLKIGIIAFLAFILGGLMVSFATGYDQQIVKYMAGKYGEKCYISGQEHGNIEYEMEFDSLESCLEYVNPEQND
jgi:hypothetical protein